MSSEDKIVIRNLEVFYDRFQALKGINLRVKKNEILAITGPAGSGKTTLLRALNRLNDLIYSARIRGEVLLDGQDIYRDEIDVSQLRKRVGMVFALPTALPKTVFENVAYGPRLAGIRNKNKLNEIVEESLREAALWDEVKDRLEDSALKLSGGQQQRLCLARILALRPEVILLDEPCSGLDPISTLKIEKVLGDLKRDYTIVLVTHNPQQAARVSDHTAFLLLGELIEYGTTEEMFTSPKDQRTDDYFSGRFG